MHNDTQIPFEGLTPNEIRKILENILGIAKPKTFKERFALWCIKFMLFLSRVKAFLGAIPSKLYELCLKIIAFAKQLFKRENPNVIIA